MWKIVVFSILLSSMASAQDRSCYNETVVFGASISAGYRGPMDVVKARISHLGRESMPLNNPRLGAQDDPGTLLAKKMNPNGVVHNLARINGRGSVLQITDPVLVSGKLEQSPSSLVSESQVEQCLKEINDIRSSRFENGGLIQLREKRRRLEAKTEECTGLKTRYELDDVARKLRASDLWIGVDAYYWESIVDPELKKQNTIDLKEGMELQCARAIQNINNLTREAHQRGKTLFLGNIPYEEGTEVSKLIASFWTPPQKKCADSLNKALRETCREENNCHILDLKTIVQDLNSEEGIEYKGKRYYQRDFRKDGLHLSPLGADYVAGRLFEKLPFFCKNTMTRTQENFSGIAN